MKRSLKTYLCMAATGLSLFSVSQVAQATCSSEAYVGSVCFTAATYCPNDYLEAQGQILPVSQYQALFSVVGGVYGGDSRTTFGIPDLRGRSPVGLGLGAGLTQPVTPGEKRGTETNALTLAQMPNHSHTATFTPVITPGTPPVVKAVAKDGVSQTPSATNNQLSTATGPTAKIYGPAAGASDTQINLAGVSGGGAAGISGTVAVAATGGSQPFAIIPPQVALRACIAVNGYYPPRP